MTEEEEDLFLPSTNSLPRVIRAKHKTLRIEAPNSIIHASFCKITCNRSVIHAQNCTIVGNYNQIHGANNVVLGNRNECSGTVTYLCGENNTARCPETAFFFGHKNVIYGNDHHIFGDWNKVFGKDIKLQGDFNAVIGTAKSVSGSSNFVNGKPHITSSFDQNDDEEAPSGSAPCVVCHTNKPIVLFSPCAHLVTCVSCAIKLQELNSPCPLCKAHIVETTRIFTL